MSDFMKDGFVEHENIYFSWYYRYTGPLLDFTKLSVAVKDGATSLHFTGLVAWFSGELATFIDIDETVRPAKNQANTFLLELSLFLREMGCVNEKLVTGCINHRLSTESERLLLLEYLATELMASKLLEDKYPKEEKQLEITIVSIWHRNEYHMLQFKQYNYSLKRDM